MLDQVSFKSKYSMTRDDCCRLPTTHSLIDAGSSLDGFCICKRVSIWCLEQVYLVNRMFLLSVTRNGTGLNSEPVAADRAQFLLMLIHCYYWSCWGHPICKPIVEVSRVVAENGYRWLVKLSNIPANLAPYFWKQCKSIRNLIWYDQVRM